MTDELEAGDSPKLKAMNPTEAKRLSRSWRRQSEMELALILDHVKSPFNIGSILRTAASLRVRAIYAVGLDVDQNDSKVQKTALGTHRFVDIQTFPTVVEAVEKARTDGYEVVGLDLVSTASPIWEIDLSRNICLILGNEDKGVSPKALQKSDAVAYIPMLGKVGSMNVATAAGIAMYEVRRQHLKR